MNIHRKDKAKTKESKTSPTKSYNHFSLSSISSSNEVPNNNHPGFAHLPPFHSYQPHYNPANFDASRPEQRGHGEDHGELDLSLNVGVNNDEYGVRRNENEDESEVDLELRLGYHPRKALKKRAIDDKSYMLLTMDSQKTA
ncbi:hypothetical protein Leryth_026236 [Lithospermum erythrorhizon]|nr:hypothetical protein Leryth_026236 [Lithospermum erythrorhizon]